MANILHKLEAAEDDANLAFLRSEIARLRLTDEEREAVERQARSLERDAERSGMIGLQEMLLQDAATLRGLLERTAKLSESDNSDNFD